MGPRMPGRPSGRSMCGTAGPPGSVRRRGKRYPWRSGKGVAARWVARVEPGLEPRLAVRRAAVRERVLVHPALGLLLDRVVAHRGRRPEGLVDVATVEAVLGERGVRPRAGE